MQSVLALRWICLALALLLPNQARAETIELTLQTRDAKTGQASSKKYQLDPRKTAAIIIDPWNYHWCMTWNEQAGGIVPRMNKVLQGARKLGMQVLWAPTDVASMYAGYPQRERALASRYVKVPQVRKYDLQFTLPRGAAIAGRGLPACPTMAMTECRRTSTWTPRISSSPARRRSTRFARAWASRT